MIWTTKLDDLNGGKVLYANGCSFTIGDELINPRSQAFPTLLGNDINCDFIVNQARCGSSNHEVLRKTIWDVSVLQSFLKKYNINYFFFKIDNGQHIMWNQTGDEITDGYDLNKLTTMDYLKEIDVDKFPSLIDSKLTFREFALTHGSLKPDYHPDELSHKLFAEHIKEKLYE